MTGDNLHGYDSSGVQKEALVGTKQKRRLTCHASFARHEVRVVVEQPADGVGKASYNSAHRQCLLHMVAYPPSTFDCETSGKFSSPRTEVVLKPCVLEKLPLLKDIAQHTDGEDGTSTKLELPCSVWGLVSLLLLLEGSVKLNHWFGDCDPSLPAQTLLAAEFMGCKASRDQVVKHLQNILIGLVEHSQKNLAAAASSDAVQSLSVHQPYSRAWHNTQVLRQLPMSHSADVFCTLGKRSGSSPEAVACALHLPQDLLARWVASAAPVLDLRSAQLTALQWSRLFNALAQGGDNITELHVCATTVEGRGTSVAARSSFMQEIQQHSSSQQATATCYRCRHGCAMPRLSHDSFLTLSKKCSNCGQHASVHGSPAMPIQEDPSALYNGTINIDNCSQVLNTLAGVLPQLLCLQHVGLHNVALQSQLMPALGQALLDLPPSVTTLTLTVSEASKAAGLVPLQRGMLFNAIALVRGLRELHMPDWEAIVGEDSACVEPLYGLPHLEVVRVPEVKQGSAFPAELTFKALQVAPGADNPPIA